MMQHGSRFTTAALACVVSLATAFLVPCGATTAHENDGRTIATAPEQAVPPAFTNMNFDEGSGGWTYIYGGSRQTAEYHSSPAAGKAPMGPYPDGSVDQTLNCYLPGGGGAKVRAWIKMPLAGSWSNKVFDLRCEGMSGPNYTGNDTFYSGGWAEGLRNGPYPDWTLVEWDCPHYAQHTDDPTRSVMLRFCSQDGPGAFGDDRPVYIDDVQFHVYPPHINSVGSDSIEKGDTITVSGVGFDYTKGNAVVLVGGVEATDVQSWGENEVSVKVPDLALGSCGRSGAGGDESTTIPVKVTTAEGTSNEVEVYVPPDLSSLSPSSGTIGAEITLGGKHFGSSQGNGKIYFGTAEASATSWSGTGIKTRVPTGTVNCKVKVTTDGGESTERDFTVEEGIADAPPVPDVATNPELKTNYFAEGTTRNGYEEFLCLSNPNNTKASANVTYMLETGESIPQNMEVLPRSRFTLRVKDAIPEGHDVSIRVSSEEFLVVERPIYYLRNGTIGVIDGGDVAMGVNVPQKEWYFAEGCTRTTPRAFEEYICVLNPGEKSANVTFAFMLSEGENKVHGAEVKPHSRYTVPVADVVGLQKDVSASVVSDEPVVAERVIYFNYGGWIGGHNAVGLNKPETRFYFAEGCTRVDLSRGMQFSEWISIQNPGDERAHVKANFILETGQVVPYETDIDPRRRQTISVTGVVGQGHDVSAEVTSDKPIIAERPMYFAIGQINGGHNVVGATTTGADYYFAEGTTRGGFNEWMSIMNTGDRKATVTMYASTTGGDALTSQFIVEPHSRKTVSVAERFGTDLDLSIRVSSNEPVLAERPIYFDFAGFQGGSVVSGWEVPE